MAQQLAEPLRRRHEALRLRVAEIAEASKEIVGVPQVVLRLGYGPTVKPTPKPPVSDVVELEE